MNWPITATIGSLIQSGALVMSDGYRTKRSELGVEGFRIVRAADIVDGTVRLDAPDFVRQEFASMIGVKSARAGDVVLTTKGTVGRVAIVPEISEHVVYSPQLCFFRVEANDMLDARFLRFWFDSAEFRHQASHRMNNSDMAPYINLVDIRSLRLTLPPLVEQQAIADMLGALDDKIAANVKLRLGAEGLLKAEFDALRMIMDEPSANRLVLNDLCDLSPKTPAPTSGEPTYLDMQKLPTRGMTIDSWEQRPARGGARFQNGDTLMARITPCLENRKTGYVDFVPPGETGLGSTEYIVMRPRPGVPAALPYFIAVNEEFRQFAIRHMVGTSGRQRVSAEDLRPFVLNAPSAEGTNRFEKLSGPVLQLFSSLRDESRTLTQLRDVLLPPLTAGRLRVRDAEKQINAVV